jgi:predicted DNA-binding transcriptional regulator YafY
VLPQFLDRLPLVIQTKAEPGTQLTPGRGRQIGQLLDATLQHRRTIMRYHSFASDREKDYVIEPYRVVFAQGALRAARFLHGKKPGLYTMADVLGL